MTMQMTGLVAYNKALTDFQNTQKTMRQDSMDFKREMNVESDSFKDLLSSSLGKVNELQKTKNTMITSFASGETQNVHELMINMQKASVAMKMTAQVRNKVLEAYKEMSKLQF